MLITGLGLGVSRKNTLLSGLGLPFDASLEGSISAWFKQEDANGTLWLNSGPDGGNMTGVVGEEPTADANGLIFTDVSPGNAMIFDTPIDLIGRTTYVVASYNGTTEHGQILSHQTVNTQVRFSNSATQTIINGFPANLGPTAINGQDTTITRIIQIIATASSDGVATDGTCQITYINDAITSGVVNHDDLTFPIDQIGRRAASSERLKGRIDEILSFNGTSLDSSALATVHSYLETRRS